MWNYHAKVVRVVDGDTYDVMIDLGFYIYHKIRIRLRGVDTPEIYGANASDAGRAAYAYVKNLIEGKDVTITTYKTSPNTFNRWEADVTFVDDLTLVRQLSEHLVERGYATKVNV